MRATAPSALHEFVPYPLTTFEIEKNHVCSGLCACQECSRSKGDREVHYQTRDRRRTKTSAPAVDAHG